jgi:hypothetical protein
MSEHDQEFNPAEGAGDGDGQHTSDLPHFEDGGEAAADAPEPDSQESSQRDAAGSNAADSDYKSPEYGVKSDQGGDAGEAEVQAKMDVAEDKGFFGTVADPTPNENYTLQTPPSAPTPETDPELARSVGNFGRFAANGAILPNGEAIGGR